jgi:hypothetical protein
LATAAAYFHKLLQFPHTELLRALPSSWLEQFTPLYGAAVAVTSITWGVVLSLLWRARRRPPHKAGAATP